MPSRLHVLRPVIALLAALLVVGALQPAADAATKRSLSVAAGPAAAVAKTAVTFSGKLTKSPKGTTVKVQRKVGAKWVAAGSARTSSTAGGYAAKVTLPAKAGVYSFRAVAAKTSKLKAATSRTVKVTALTRVVATIKASPTAVPAGGKTVLSGTVRPYVAFTYISIQKKEGNGWTAASFASVDAKGNYSREVTPLGTTTYRISIARTKLLAAAVSGGVTVASNPVISTSTLPAGTVGTPYSQKLIAVASPTGTWSVTGLTGTGLSLNPTTGAITGTPTTAGTTVLTVGFTDSGGLSAAPATIDLVVDPATPPVISTTTLPGGTAGTPYTAQLAVSGNPAGNWTVTPGLPNGLSLNGLTGAITGTPTAASAVSHTFTFHQTNTGLSGSSSPIPITIVLPPAPVILTLSLPDARPTPFDYSAQLFVSGGVAGTWSEAGLPNGLTLNAATGAITGKATVLPNTYNVTFVFTRTGTNQTATKVLPLKVANVATTVPVAVSAGGQFSCRTDASQKLWCWGYNESGQLGINAAIGDGPGKLTPQQVGTATDWSGVTTGANNLVTERHACALRGTDAWCWGSDKNGELGVGGSATGTTAVPNKVAGALAWSNLSAGWNSTCGVTTTGALYCWGKNDQGQLGTGGTGVNAPVRVGVASDWATVSAGYNFTCATKASGTLWCWGSNYRGQLGTGDRVSTSTPVQVGSATTWSKIQVGYGYTCGIRADATLWCWGITEGGSLGNGETANDTAKDVLAPAQVGTAANWVDVAAGSGQTCAVNTGGQLWCWGINGNGQVGNNTTANQGTPVRIGTATSWTSVSAGDAHTCGVQADSQVFCWGANPKGQLGNGSTTQSLVPVAVTG